MRLLNVNTFDFSEFPSRKTTPRYAILSHRWGCEESRYKEAKRKHDEDVAKPGYKKIKAFARYVKKHLQHIEWIWVDTCCIDQESSAELSEAINSMYEWYSGAEVCIAFLAGVTTKEDLERFKQDEWFKRGWTLQELLAPPTVVFVTRAWEVIGHKGKNGRRRSGIDMDSGPSLTSAIVAVTGIPDLVLDDFQQSKNFSVKERLQWVEGRDTKFEEDKWYSLLGIFGVSMPAAYGERGESAKRRLLEAIHGMSESHKQQYLSTRLVGKDSDEYRKMVGWLSPPDPGDNHATAKQKHQPNTQGGLFGNALQEASLRGNETIVKMLIESGADVNAQGGEYGNALQAALSLGNNEKVVKMLIESGADVNAQGGWSGTALQVASLNGYETVVNMLIESGADVNAQGGDFNSAVQAASFGGYEKVVKMLIESGADVNAKGGDFGSAMQLASFEGHHKVVKILLESGADVNAQGGDFGSALQQASFGGKESIVKMLIESGADVNAQGRWCGTALQAASLNGYETVVNMLIESGAMDG